MDSLEDIKSAIKASERFLVAAQKAGDKEAIKDLEKTLKQLKGQLDTMAKKSKKLNELNGLITQAENKDLKSFRKNLKEALKKKVVARLNEKEQEIAKRLFNDITKK